MTTGEKRRHRAQVDDGAHLWPKHREVLRGYGLNDETIDAWGCFTTAQEDLAEFARGVQAPGIALPILPPGTRKPKGFLYRPDQPRMFEKNGKRQWAKYEHAVKATNHIHVPQSVHARLAAKGEERVKVLVITEGPIKAEVAAQEGIDCVALPGVWNWRQRFGDESVPIEDLNKLPWAEFDHVEICFDSDAATNPNVQKAEHALASWLLRHEAREVCIVRLPAADDGSKVGLDDYLCEHSAKDFKKLPWQKMEREPRLVDLVEGLAPETDKKERNRVLGRVMSEEHDPSERERWLKLAAKRTGISIRALQRSAQIAGRRIEQKKGHMPTSAQTPFKITEEGIFWQKDGHEPRVWLSARIDVVAMTRDSANENWGRLLKWRDGEGHDHQWAMPMELLASDSRAILARLLQVGLNISPDSTLQRKLLEYLGSTQTDKFLRCVSRIGWQGDTFVLPGGAIGPEGCEEVLYQAPQEGAHSWNESGTVPRWREKVGRLCAGNSRLVLSVSCSFLGPMLNLVGAESGGFHLFGRHLPERPPRSWLEAQCAVAVDARASFNHGDQPQTLWKL